MKPGKANAVTASSKDETVTKCRYLWHEPLSADRSILVASGWRPNEYAERICLSVPTELVRYNEWSHGTLLTLVRSDTGKVLKLDPMRKDSAPRPRLRTCKVSLLTYSTCQDGKRAKERSIASIRVEFGEEDEEEEEESPDSSRKVVREWTVGGGSGQDEKTILREALQEIKQQDPDVLISLNRELEFLADRAGKQVCQRALGRHNATMGDELARGRLVVRVMPALRNSAHARDLSPIVLTGPETVVYSLSCANEQHDLVFAALKEGLELSDVLAIGGSLARIVGMSLKELLQRGPLVRNEHLIEKYLFMHKLPAPDTKKLPAAMTAPLQGGLVLDSKNGFFEFAVLLDIYSTYPNSMKELDLCLGQLKLAELVDHLLTLRKEAKTDADGRAIKLCLNSLYGCLANRNFKFFDLDAARRITELGRSVMRFMVEVATEHGYPVILGDTDSLLLAANSQEEAARMGVVMCEAVAQKYAFIRLRVDAIGKNVCVFGARQYAMLVLKENGETEERTRGLPWESRGVCEGVRSVLKPIMSQVLAGTLVPPPQKDKVATDQLVVDILTLVAAQKTELKRGLHTRKRGREEEGEGEEEEKDDDDDLFVKLDVSRHVATWAMYMQLDKNPEEYDKGEGQRTKHPHHVNAALQVLQMSGPGAYRAGDFVPYFMGRKTRDPSKSPPEAFHPDTTRFRDVWLAWDWYFNKNMDPLVNRLCERLVRPE